MQQKMTFSEEADEGSKARFAGGRRAFILFVNFFLIILAYYQIKPASRSFFVEYLGSELLPYVWIGTALVWLLFIGMYHEIVRRFERLTIVLASCGLFIALLVGFRLWLMAASQTAAFAFYIFVDIFSVVLVEQFWSLANTVHTTHEGRRWYGFVGTGGLVGGVVSGAFAGTLIHKVGLTSQGLLLVAAALLGGVILINLAMARAGLYQEAESEPAAKDAQKGWKPLIKSKYLLLIAAMLLAAQMAQPIVEYQFINRVEAAYADLNDRTAYLSWFFSVLSLVAIAVNLTLTPIIHRFLGVMAGLLVQPLALSLFSLAFFAQPLLTIGSAMKVSDRGLSYSINRASKEVLYIPIDPVVTYQAKAWIDMFGYRAFKVVGSLLILGLGQAQVSVAGLSWATVAICAGWLLVLVLLAQEYRRLLPATDWREVLA
jgi:AAA family ATP:ADP antiporter